MAQYRTLQGKIAYICMDMRYKIVEAAMVDRRYPINAGLKKVNFNNQSRFQLKHLDPCQNLKFSAVRPRMLEIMDCRGIHSQNRRN